MTRLLVDHVSFEYVTGRHIALRDITLEIPAGQVVLLAGPSGCGKTTLGYAMAGLLPERVAGRMKGSVYFGSQRLTGMPLHEVAQHVGLVFQNPESQLFQYDVESEVAFGPENLNLPHDEIVRRVNRSVSATALHGFTSQATNTLSGGQRQRVAIAAMLAMQPSVLVLDEPTADLDPLGTQEVLGVIRQLNERYHMTVVLIEHKIDEVVGWADRIILMDEGRVILDADPHRAFEDDHVWERLKVAVPQMVQLSHALPDFFNGSTALTVDEAEEALSQYPDILHALRQDAGPIDLDRSYRDNPVIEWEHVHLSYGGRPVLNNVSFEVYPEEWVALVGSNGSGKTSLAGMAMGFDVPWEGAVRFDGRPVRRGHISAQAGNLGYLYQSPEMMLFGDTVEHELRFTELYGAHDPRRKTRSVEELAGFTDLRQRLTHNPYQLSYGQRQRLAIASLLATNPKALILDEPTTGQDEGHAQAVLDFLQLLQQTYGVALLMISHDMRAVARYANRVAVLSPQGKIVSNGPPAVVFAQTEALEECHLTAPPVADLHNRLAQHSLSRVALSVYELLNILGRNSVSAYGPKGALLHD